MEKQGLDLGFESLLQGRLNLKLWSIVCFSEFLICKAAKDFSNN